MPALSLIIAARNAAAHIGDALSCVAPDLDCEILVADGNSSDRTVDIARSHPRVRIVSHADSGIYDGMNRAIAAATGRAVLILNSDDLLLPGATELALRRLEEAPDAGWISGTALFGSGLDGATERHHHRALTPEGAMFGVPAINARLFRRELLARLGPIRTDLGLASDREFLMRVARSGGRGVPLGRPLYFYRVHAGSQTIAGDTAGYARVYGAEETLASRLLADPDTDVETRNIAALSAAVAAVKRRIRGMDAGAAVLPHGAGAALSGAILALRWRGRLSGY